MESTTKKSDVAVWCWNQPVDIRHAVEFHAKAVEALRAGMSGPLVIDLGESTHMDASGLQILVAIAVQALSRGRFFEIVKASYSIERDLQLAGVSYLLKQRE